MSRQEWSLKKNKINDWQDEIVRSAFYFYFSLCLCHCTLLLSSVFSSFLSKTLIILLLFQILIEVKLYFISMQAVLIKQKK